MRTERGQSENKVMTPPSPQPPIQLQLALSVYIYIYIMQHCIQNGASITAAELEGASEEARTEISRYRLMDHKAAQMLNLADLV